MSFSCRYITMENLINNLQNRINKIVVLMAITGSNNYNLNNIKSDIDWKAFVIGDSLLLNPSCELIGNNDILIMNKSQFLLTLIQMNPKFLEVLFSNTILSTDNVFKEKLIVMRDNIARMDLKRLYNMCLLEYNKHLVYINKSKSTKQINTYRVHLYRWLDILYRFYNTDFTDFSHAIRYKKNEDIRSILIDTKEGLIQANTLDALITEKHKKILSLESCFNQNIDKITKEKLIDLFN